MVGIIFAKEITSRIAMTVSIETKKPVMPKKKSKSKMLDYMRL